MGSLVGQTEKLTRQAFQIINAQPGCIVFIDEIEKALSGTNSQTNDSSIRQGGQILQWLNDEKEDIYVIATANDVTKLPPEFLRAGRWDALFFADLPTEEEANQLLEHFCQKFEIDRGETPIDVVNWTGAEIESLCRIASSIEIPLEEAKAYVQPISKVANEKIVRLREWAQTRTIDASNVVKKQINQNQTRKAVHL
jgi:SpoVK/Ycf46/Vps4 family AAA+-type ATPase